MRVVVQLALNAEDLIAIATDLCVGNRRATATEVERWVSAVLKNEVHEARARLNRKQRHREAMVAQLQLPCLPQATEEVIDGEGYEEDEPTGR